MFIRRLAVAIGLLFALIGTQGPEFAQQYRQRLAGAIDELRREVAAFDADATSQSLTPNEAIKRLETNPDPLARDRGEAAAADQQRLDKLQDALVALKNAPPVARLVTFIENYDPRIAAQAWSDFEPATPTTYEAFAIGAVAGVIGWALTHLSTWPVRRHLARRRAQQA